MSPFSKSNEIMQTVLTKLFDDVPVPAPAPALAPVITVAPASTPAPDTAKLERRLAKLDDKLEKAYKLDVIGEEMKTSWIRNLLDQKMRTMLEM